MADTNVRKHLMHVLVIPVGKNAQNLILITKKGGKLSTKTILPVRFLPMTGEAEKRSR